MSVACGPVVVVRSFSGDVAVGTITFGIADEAMFAGSHNITTSPVHRHAPFCETGGASHKLLT